MQRLASFCGAFPIDAVLALSPLEEVALERLLSSGALVFDAATGFRIDPLIDPLVRAMGLDPRERRSDVVAFGRWLLEHIASVEASTADSASAFDRLEPIAPDARAAVDRLAPEDPALAAELWCAISDLIFYRRLLAFDCPEYETAIRCADEANDPPLRARTRIVAGRAMMEVRAPSHARRFFEAGRDIARDDGGDEWHADAIRGLGWVSLAEGDLAGAKDHFTQAYTVHRAAEHARGIADACMALGVLNMLLGNPTESGRLFFQAEAILRARHDTVRLAKLAGLRQTFGLADGGIQPAELDLQSLLSRGQYWRASLLLLRSDETDAKGRAQILADLAGVSWKELVASSRAPTPSIPKGADADSNASWELRQVGIRRVLVAPDGETHDLTRRGPFVKLIAALASSQGPLSAISLFEAAWPRENVRHESALLRVYTTVRRLRNLGVPIATSGDGYLCDRIRSVL